jgi:hypothetical protein
MEGEGSHAKPNYSQNSDIRHLSTGEMIGVGEDGTHQFIVILTAEITLFAYIVTLLFKFIETLIARFHVWRGASILTWQHFWHNVAANNNDKDTPQQIYERTLKETKDYMNTTAWDQLAHRSERPHVVGIISIAPGPTDLTGLFGLSQIIWFVWLGIVMLRSDLGKAA